MSQNHDSNGESVAPDNEGKERIIATDLRVGAGGRVTIPDEKRERYGIEQGDFIDAVLFAEREAGGDGK